MIGVVIVSYKSYENTINYVINELSKLNDSLHIVLVNVGVSVDDDDSILKNFQNNLKEKKYNYGMIERLTILNYVENLGYAKGNTKGLEYIKSNYPEITHVLITNNDIIINDSFILTELKKEMASFNNAVMIGPRVIGTDGRNQSPHRKMSIWSMIIIPKLLWFVPFSKTMFEEVIHGAPSGPCYRLMGSFFLIDLKKFLNVGGFDTNTFLYGEELILAEIFAKNNLKTIYLDKVSVIHNHSTTISKYYKNSQHAKILQDSLVYYFENYRKVGVIPLTIAKISFSFNNTKYFLKNILQALKTNNENF